MGLFSFRILSCSAGALQRLQCLLAIALASSFLVAGLLEPCLPHVAIPQLKTPERCCTAAWQSGQMVAVRQLLQLCILPSGSLRCMSKQALKKALNIQLNLIDLFRKRNKERKTCPLKKKSSTAFQRLLSPPAQERRHSSWKRWPQGIALALEPGTALKNKTKKSSSKRKKTYYINI